MVLKVDNVAPDFMLKDQHGKEFKLSDFRGKVILLSFHPLAWTKVCAEQMKSLEARMEDFESLNVVVAGLSVDSVPCKHAWMKSLGIKNLRVLADFWPHGEVAKNFGILRKEGFSERANIVIDKTGRIVWVKVYAIPELPDANGILRFLKNYLKDN